MPGKPTIPRACEHCSAPFLTWAYSVRNGHGRFCSALCSNVALRLKHGESSPSTTSPEYRAWHSMKVRCLKPTHHAYASYGGRGITVCERWRDSFEAFLADVGRRPSPIHSLDRIDNDGNYEPGNVRWATKMEQAQNRRQHSGRLLTFNGVTQPVKAWAQATGISVTTLNQRLRTGWNVERTLTVSPDLYRRSPRLNPSH